MRHNCEWYKVTWNQGGSDYSPGEEKLIKEFNGGWDQTCLQLFWNYISNSGVTNKCNPVYRNSQRDDIKKNNRNLIRHWWKKLKSRQINGKIFCSHGWEELKSLKCPHDSKQSIDLI